METDVNISSGMPIRPKEVRYIKLGKKGGYEKECLDRGIMRLGFQFISHEAALAGDREAMQAAAFARRGKKGSATGDVRQVTSFHELGEDCLWITFVHDRLYWGLAAPEVVWVSAEDDPAGTGYRYRNIPEGWRSTDIAGKPLLMEKLSGHLTRVASYQSTICEVEASDYLIRKINGEDLPEITKARAERQSFLATIEDLVKLTTWQDFELLVDLIFSSSGWRRTSTLGGTQKTIDLALELPTTGETAFVQVKAKTDKREFEDYMSRFEGRGEDRMFYVYHTGPSSLQADDDSCTIIGPSRLAEMILNAGLFDWLVDRVN